MWLLKVHRRSNYVFLATISSGWVCRGNPRLSQLPSPSIDIDYSRREEGCVFGCGRTRNSSIESMGNNCTAAPGCDFSNDHMQGMSFDARSASFPPGAAATLCEFFESVQFPCNREKAELVRRTVGLLSSRLLPTLRPYAQPLQRCSPKQINMWFINKRRRARAQLKGGTEAVRRNRKPRAHRAVQHRKHPTDTEPTVFGLFSDLRSPRRSPRGHSTVPDVQQDASDGLASYLPQSARALCDGSDWSDLVASSDSENHTSACTSACSTASTASISPRATDMECADMLQFLEQCLGLTGKDITTPPFNLPAPAAFDIPAQAAFDIPASYCQTERTETLKSAHAVCPDVITGPSGPPRWRYLPDILVGRMTAPVDAQNAWGQEPHAWALA